MVVCVEEVFSLLAARLVKVVLVERLNFRVEVRHADRRPLIVGVEACGASCSDFVRREAGLTAAADATTAARHNFDEVIPRLDAVLQVLAHFIQDLLDIAHLVGNGDIDGCAVDIDCRSLDAVYSANRGELDRRRLSFLGDEAVCRAQRRFHNAARNTEDGACARVGTEQIVGGLFGKGHEVDAGGLDHTGKLTRGENDVRILAARGLHVLVAGDFVLLGRAGHDGSYMHLVACKSILFSPV